MFNIKCILWREELPLWQKNMRFKNYDSQKKSLLIILMLVFISFVLPLFLLGAGSGEKKTDGYDKNSYLKTLYYSVPLIKVVDNPKNEMMNDIGFKDRLLYVLGIDIFDPFSIVSKEISYLRTDVKYTENNEEEKKASFDSYKLNSKDVAMNVENKNVENKTENDDKNDDISDIPNRIVEVYNPKLKKKINTSKPEVLIYHTHTSESYMPVEDGFSYDDKYNVCGVGDALKSELENNYGIAVINDKTVHDTNYLQAYTKSAETLDKYLKKYKDFKLIIDMHRDSGLSKSSVTAKMNGENVAKIMFVTTTSSSKYKKNIVNVNKLYSISDKLFPGFCKDIYNIPHGINSFNQNKSSNAVLIEVGSNINTADESRASAKYLARIIGEYINGSN